jgi:site-specific DNA-methyltransferase (adenine-specific)
MLPAKARSCSALDNGVELRDLEAYGEPGAIVYQADCVDLRRLVPAGSVDVIFADPPYRLSTGGVTSCPAQFARLSSLSRHTRTSRTRRGHRFSLPTMPGTRRASEAQGEGRGPWD